MKRQIVGALGSIFAALCCIGAPALLGLLASIGLGFLIRDAILLPLLIVFLGVSLWGARRSMARHGQQMPFMVAAMSSVVIMAAVWFSRPLVLLGLTGLIAASVWDIYLYTTCAPSEHAAGREA